MPLLLLADTYSSGVYSGGVYGAAVTPTPTPTSAPLVQVGPLILPNTGAGWSVLIGIALLAFAVGLAVWLRRRHAA